MSFAKRLKTPLVLCAIVSSVLSGCSNTSQGFSAAALKDAVTPNFVRSSGYTTREKDCMARAMFFESHRSSRDGMIAVGTVVMNRKRSGKHPDTVCGVVGEKGQFAPGVMTRKMNSKALPDVMEAAEAVMKGERHPKLKSAMHFHTAGLKFKYKNMHYVTVAGGNAFYEKRSRGWKPLPTEDSVSVMVASAEPAVEPVAPTTALALAAPDENKAEKIITAAIPLPAKAAPRPQVVTAAVEDEESAPVVEAPAASFQPAADINPARFQ